MVCSSSVTLSAEWSASWMTNMGHGEVRALFGEGERKHELCVTTIQMCVLMMFNDEGVDEVPYKRMRKELFNDNLGNGESEGELKRCLQSLAWRHHWCDLRTAGSQKPAPHCESEASRHMCSAL